MSARTTNIKDKEVTLHSEVAALAGPANSTDATYGVAMLSHTIDEDAPAYDVVVTYQRGA